MACIPSRADANPGGKVSPFATDTLTPLFCPRSVAIVGASDDPTRILGRALRYLIDGGFQGEILPVNPTRPAVQGLKAYASIAKLQQVPDVAIIAVSSRLTGGAVRECASKGVKAVVLFSAGYAETGDEGAGAQAGPSRKPKMTAMLNDKLVVMTGAGWDIGRGSVLDVFSRESI